MTTTNYQQQAIDFLQSTNTEFSVKYVKTGKHFSDDKQERDIYEIELKRGNRSFAFRFGQSIQNSGKYILLDGRLKAEFGRNFINDKEYKKITVPYFDKKAALRPNKNYSEPTAYDVLACITKYDPGTFEDFCSEFGYDTDSKKAEKTYLAVKDEYLNVCKLFTDAEIEQLAEIN